MPYKIFFSNRLGNIKTGLSIHNILANKQTGKFYVIVHTNIYGTLIIEDIENESQILLSKNQLKNFQIVGYC